MAHAPKVNEILTIAMLCYEDGPHAHGVSISGKMTFSEGQQHLVDPEASLRAELTGAIAAAQIDIANAIAELARSGAGSAALANQGQALQQLQRTIGSANLGSLLALRQEVAATSSSASALANQAIATASSAAAAQANLSPAERARATIEALHRDLFENKVLDPYLRFASPEDEEAYRKRESEREAEIKRQIALGTPEGNRRATELLQDQLRDAGAHGADRSPDFADIVARTTGVNQAIGSAAPRQQAEEVRATVQPEILGIAATLKAAGLSSPDISGDQTQGHGLSIESVLAQVRTV